MGLFLYYQPNNTNHGRLVTQLTCIVWSNVISAVSMLFLIFVPWKKGPAWYMYFSDKLFFGLLLLVYIFIPVVNNIFTIYWICLPSMNLKVEPIECYIIFFNVVCFMRIFEYFAVIRRTVILDARAFKEQRALEDLKSTDEIREEMILERRDDTKE